MKNISNHHPVVFFVITFFMQHLKFYCTTGDLCKKHQALRSSNDLWVCSPFFHWQRNWHPGCRNQDSTIQIGDDALTSSMLQLPNKKNKSLSELQPVVSKRFFSLLKGPFPAFRWQSTEKSWCMKCWSKPVLSDTDPFHTSTAPQEVQPLPSTIRNSLGGLIIIDCGGFQGKQTRGTNELGWEPDLWSIIP